VAAVSLAKRVSDELNAKFGETVGYQIRYDSHFYSPEKTKIKFMTDGILLKELETDFLLRKYSVLIIDEAHERSLNSDILVSLLTRIA
jgi:ATP-dependent RNA helicase DHX37/DHR1